MNKLIYIIVIYMICILSACRPNELPEETVEEPEYAISGTMDGQSFNLEIGPDNVFINSEAEIVENEIPLFNVEINGEECAECVGSFELVISGAQEFNEDLDLLDLILEGNYNVSHPNFSEGEVELELWTDIGPFGAVDVNNFPIENNSILNLDPGTNFISLLAPINGMDFSSNSYYAADFDVLETGETCFEQTVIEYTDGFLAISVPESRRNLITQFVVGEKEMSTGQQEDIVFSQPQNLHVIEGYTEIFEFDIYYDQEACVEHEYFSWSTELGGIVSSGYDYPEMYIMNNFESGPDPISVSLVYTNMENEVFSSTELGQDWFEITNIEVASSGIFNITFSCMIDLVNVENPQESLMLQLENAVIPLVFE